jgi:alcohol dehydrogenase class IV
MTDANETELIEQLKDLPHGKLTAAAVLLSSQFVSGNTQERMLRVAKYLHDAVATLEPSIGQQLLLFTYQILKRDELDRLFSSEDLTIDKLAAVVFEGSSILVEGVEKGLFQAQDIREYFNHVHELSRLTLLPESDDRANNEGVDKVLNIMETLQKSV